MKKDQIYRKFKQEIISGLRKDGEKLPTEFECMALFDVSRDTVRSAYKMLEDEGYLKRVRSKGAFIQLPETSPEKRNISLLVPCEEYLWVSGLHFQKILFDLIAETALAGWSLTPVIFSRTNSNTDIWWENLEKFNSESRIVVNRMWFAHYFETLAAIKAKVAFINNDVTDNEYQHFTDSWINFIEDDAVVARNAVKKLYDAGCRKIALVMPGLFEKYNSFFSGYLEQIRELGLTPRLLEDKKNSFPDIQSFRKESGCDALIMHLNEYTIPRKNTLHESLGLPPEIPIIAIPCKSEMVFQSQEKNIQLIQYPIRKMAHDIVQNLTTPLYTPRKIHYTPTI